MSAAGPSQGARSPSGGREPNAVGNRGGAMTTPLLQVKGLRVAYGHIEAVKGIDLELNEGQITTLVGANGAGKSTTLLALSGLVKKASGQVTFDGKDLSRMAPHKIVSSGVVQVAEGRATLTTLTVRENLELGAYTRRGRYNRADELDAIYALFPVLKERASACRLTLLS